MLSKAVEVAARRTGYVNTVYATATARERDRLEQDGRGGGVLTNTQLANFLRNHKKLYECVDFIFGEDGDNQLSKMGLSPGRCAGIYYLMMAGETSLEEYQADRCERSINFSFEEQARGFWVEFAKDVGHLEKLRQALAYIHATDKEQGIFGRKEEKDAVICHAWRSFISDLEVTEETVNLRYQRNVVLDSIKQQWTFIDPPTFDGIDCPPKSKTYDPAPSVIKEETTVIQQLEKERMEAARRATQERSKQPDVLDPTTSSNMADEIKKGLASSRANRMGMTPPSTKFPVSTPPVTEDTPTAPQTKQEAISPPKGPKLRGGV